MEFGRKISGESHEQGEITCLSVPTDVVSTGLRHIDENLACALVTERLDTRNHAAPCKVRNIMRRPHRRAFPLGIAVVVEVRIHIQQDWAETISRCGGLHDLRDSVQSHCSERSRDPIPGGRTFMGRSGGNSVLCCIQSIESRAGFGLLKFVADCFFLSQN